MRFSQNCEKRLFASLCRSVCLSVRPPSAWKNSAPTGQILIKLDTRFHFRKSADKIQVSLKSDMLLKKQRNANRVYILFQYIELIRFGRF